MAALAAPNTHLSTEISENKQKLSEITFLELWIKRQTHSNPLNPELRNTRLAVEIWKLVSSRPGSGWVLCMLWGLPHHIPHGHITCWMPTQHQSQPPRQLPRPYVTAQFGAFEFLPTCNPPLPYCGTTAVFPTNLFLHNNEGRVPGFLPASFCHETSKMASVVIM